MIYLYAIKPNQTKLTPEKNYILVKCVDQYLKRIQLKIPHANTLVLQLSLALKCIYALVFMTPYYLLLRA